MISITILLNETAKKFTYFAHVLLTLFLNKNTLNVFEIFIHGSYFGNSPKFDIISIRYWQSY
jgi:hypothetical protein